MIRAKKQEIALLRRELDGEREVRLSRLSLDSGTDEGEKRLQLLWQNFRIVNGTGVNATVLGQYHPGYLEGKEAAAGNTAELFEEQLFAAGPKGVHVDRLSNVHSHYFGGGFEKIVGQKLRAFVKEKYEYDDKTGVVRAPAKLLNAMRKMEARSLIVEELEEQQERKRARLAPKKEEKVFV
eukprot:TRINITY_DN75325_c0_g1_i1.p2 TRINITY_DN75325_c0_g1~~TRINITY_DN75325_c0_g1_i1.p2  ORF type:complete len:181 (+),score=49.21 TRINITY_DN75325_c0_g1_i1:122-664(+)